MDSIASWVEQNVGQINSKLRLDPVNEIHLPSFVLGCSVMISVSLLGPFIRMFIGGILLTIITLIKYLVIIGGITACVLVLTTKNKNGDMMKKKPAEEHPELVQTLKKSQQDRENGKPEGKVELAKDDFESIKYYDIPKVQLEVTRAPAENAYDRFVNMAGFKDGQQLESRG
ncbi:hypothetical protein HG536_0D03500 [Torulaspora globosa]|uniref:Uncharacterized protein n=1 Tax=Torulaspora globosa TaxID=48254 RepID=A0A7G3ZH42_9SACH|nr:uncharacterized protein HG536_0D03500 [Torulaspora globosa]QLL32828.1 hypothetical protein HG536_0D03500 [Torulaspora globosa]